MTHHVRPPVSPASLFLRQYVCSPVSGQVHSRLRLVDAVRKPLQLPYQEPFEVIMRTQKAVTTDRNGIPDSVAVDQLKPAQLLHAISPTVPPSTAVGV